MEPKSRQDALSQKELLLYYCIPFSFFGFDS